MDALPDVKLCSQCAHHWRAEYDARGRFTSLIPCAAYPGRTAGEARKTCDGRSWLAPS